MLRTDLLKFKFSAVFLPIIILSAIELRSIVLNQNQSILNNDKQAINGKYLAPTWTEINIIMKTTQSWVSNLHGNGFSVHKAETGNLFKSSTF